MPWPVDPDYPEPTYWAMWPKCPRLFEPTLYYLDQGVATISEACRWAIECGWHRSAKLSARGSFLLREYTRIRENPAALRQKIFADKLEAVRRSGGKG
jgi:hypothetical protein